MQGLSTEGFETFSFFDPKPHGIIRGYTLEQRLLDTVVIRNSGITGIIP